MTVRKLTLVALAMFLIPMAAAVAAIPGDLIVVGAGAVGSTESGNVVFGYEMAFIQTPGGMDKFSRVTQEAWQRTGLLPMPRGEQIGIDGKVRYMLELNLHGDVARTDQVVAILLDLMAQP